MTNSGWRRLPAPGGSACEWRTRRASCPRLCAELPSPVDAVTVTPPTLDDVFLHYTGRTIREVDAGGRGTKG